MSVELTTRYAGLTLAHPLVASASPLTGDPDTLVALQEAGAAAVVLPSLFEEQIEHEAMELHHGLEWGAEHYAEAAGGYLPDVAAGLAESERALDRVRWAKAALDIPVIASLNGTSTGGWTSSATAMADAGADALELNVYLVAADVEATSAEVEARYVELVEQVRSCVSIPLTVKIGPYVSSPGHLVRRLADAGADGLVLFNRFYQPDIDLDTLTVVPDLVLSRSSEMRLVLRWMAILHGRVDASLAATTGVHTAEDAVKLVLAGADVVMMTSALLEAGPSHLGEVLTGLTAWFDEREYESLDQARGSMSQLAVPDPTAFERANYIGALTSYSPTQSIRHRP